MQAVETRPAILKRILGRLPPSAVESNKAALSKAFPEDEVGGLSWDFQEETDTKLGSKFIKTPFTSSETNEELHRSPFTGVYEPGQVEEHLAFLDNPRFAPVEKTLNALMQTYLKLYFGQGTGNFYTLDTEQETLRGLAILQSKDKEAKKIKAGFWKTVCPLTCTFGPEHQISLSLNYASQCGFETESKYFGKITFHSSTDSKVKTETTEKQKYIEKNFYQVYVKHCGKGLEDTESRLTRMLYDVFYPRIQDVISQCRHLKENNDYYAQKKALIKNSLLEAQK